MEIKYTKNVHLNGVKVLVFGESKAGKTHLISTLPKPIVLAVEKEGLLTLNDFDVPYIEINSIQDILDAIKWLQAEGAQFDSIAIDSLSELAKMSLDEEIKKNGNPQGRAYGVASDQIIGILHDVFKLNKHLICTAWLDKTTDQMGRMMFAPLMVGNKLGLKMPYLFNFVMALRKEQDAEGKYWRGLLTQSDGLWNVGTRTESKLEPWEAPDLGAIIGKVQGND